MDRRPKLREEMPGLTFSEYSVKIGELWAELPEEERAPYKKLAEADKKRHAEEKQTQGKKAKKKATTSAEGGEEEESSSSSKRKRPRASKKVAGAPKGTTTAYLYYQNEISQEVRDSNPGIKFGDVAKICGARWKEMSEEDRAPFQQKAKEDKERYLKEMQAFEESRRNLVDNDDDEREDEEEEKPTKSKAKRHSSGRASSSSNVVASEKKKKKKAVAAKGDNFYEEDDSSNPIIKYFISMCMSDVHSMNPRLSKEQVKLILMDRWRQLPDDKKLIYEQCSLAQYSK